VAALFIELNGYRLAASEADVVIRTLGLAAGQIRESDYAAWLKASSRRA
jgi:death-on-curing protein